MKARGRRCTAAFSPQGYFTQVPAGRVQAELRGGFQRWGRPLSVQFDNGNPWGSWGDLPTPLALWLIGLGLGVSWIPPRTPQDKGGVERSQGGGVQLGGTGPLPQCGAVAAAVGRGGPGAARMLPPWCLPVAAGGLPGLGGFGAALQRRLGAEALVLGGG